MTKQTKKKITVYKVVFFNPFKKRRSSFSAPDDAVVDYIPNKTTRPRKGYGPLAAFATLKQAEAFLWEKIRHDSPWLEFEIWKGEAEQSKHFTLWNLSQRIGKSRFPPGTVLVDSFVPRTLALTSSSKRIR